MAKGGADATSTADIGAMIEELLAERPDRGTYWYGVRVESLPPFGKLAALSREDQARAVVALVGRLGRGDEILGKAWEENRAGVASSPYYLHGDLLSEQAVGQKALVALLRRRPPLTAAEVTALVNWGLAQEQMNPYLHPIGGTVSALEKLAAEGQLDAGAAEAAGRYIACLEGSHYERNFPNFIARLKALFGVKPTLDPSPVEPWAARSLADLEAMPDARRFAWRELIAHAQTASGARPSVKWMGTAKTLLNEEIRGGFGETLAAWARLSHEPPTVEVSWTSGGPVGEFHRNEAILKGLAWAAGALDDKPTARALGLLAMNSYKKIPGKGAKSPSVGNAAILSLGAMPGREGLAQLAVLSAKIKDRMGKKSIAKALDAAAKAHGLPADEIDELAVPDHGMTEVGRLSVPFGEFTAEITVDDDRAADIAWIRPGGKPQKSVPAPVKAEHAEALKELKATAKDIATMASAQKDRVDNLFLSRRAWPLASWRGRYLDHPIVGLIARKLLWTFTTGETTATGVFHDGRIVGRDDAPLSLGDATTVALWHPIDHPVDEVLAWRSWLEAHRVRQPFKQAHREVYLLTDAERNTRVYSNRFAAHVIKQHQFNALCAARGWSNALRLMVDASYPPASLELPGWGLRAEFWIEGIGDTYGTDTNDTGTYLRLATDQVRFYRTGAAQRFAHVVGGGYAPGRGDGDDPISLDEVPPLVFSEVLRDVDLFVGVASVGNDPNWSDGGPEGRYLDYWQSYSFGDLSATAETRKAVLQKLIPRLKIADRCAFSDKFLTVRGSIRTYKIHLGSGNILMEPNDQYLCIVPDRRATSTSPGDQVFLPFEGDSTLSIVLSKALLLADDAAIADPTIVSQLRRV